MAIPIAFQQFKSAGVYRLVYDKSNIIGVDASTLRLVVGYSPKGPFNVPAYVTSISQFRELYGTASKTLEKRGCYFHRIAEQCLMDSAILCLNLKKFANETVNASTIDTNFNVKNPIDTIEVSVEDIYDTTRFWTLSSDKLNDLRGAEYINIATTNTKETSGTYFIRKACGPKVNGYNISVADWYKTLNKDIPEYLQGYETSLMSDFMAEIYVFKGKFIAEQVLASEALRPYFQIDKKGNLALRPYIVDAFGDYSDTLDELFMNESSGALGHYVGSLIPYFTDSNGSYAALDILFNLDQDIHNMMMSFNTDMLEEEGIANIDLSGSRYIATAADCLNDHSLANTYKAYGSSVVCIDDIWNGTAKTNLLSNANSPVVADIILFNPSVFKDKKEVNGEEIGIVKTPLKYKKSKKVSGTLYVSGYDENTITLKQIGAIDLEAAQRDYNDFKDSEEGKLIDKVAELDEQYKEAKVEYDKDTEVLEEAQKEYKAAEDEYKVVEDEYTNNDAVKEALQADSDFNAGIIGEEEYHQAVTNNEAFQEAQKKFQEAHETFENAESTWNDARQAYWDKYGKYNEETGELESEGNSDFYKASKELEPYQPNGELYNDYLEAVEAFKPIEEALQEAQEQEDIIVELNDPEDLGYVLYQLGAAYMDNITDPDNVQYIPYGKYEFVGKTYPTEAGTLKGDGLGTYYTGKNPYETYHSLEGPKKIITSINRDMDAEDNIIKLSGKIIKAAVEEVYIQTSLEYCAPKMIIESEDGTTEEVVDIENSVLIEEDDLSSSWNVYGSSISFIQCLPEWGIYKDVNKYTADPDDVHTYTMYAKASDNSALLSVITKGDRFLAGDATVDMDGDNDYEDEVQNGFYDVVAVQSVETKFDKYGVPLYHEIKFTGKPMLFEASKNGISETVNSDDNTPEYVQNNIFGASAKDEIKTYLVRIDKPLNQEIGTMYPTYLEGYTYENPKPNGTGMMAKLNWQKFMLGALDEYQGLRTALLNKSEIDFRYIIDTWETFVDSSIKSTFSQLCKDKESAFAILNFPAIRTFVKCPYASFTNDRGVFNIQYVVDGKNKKKASSTTFSLPTETEGASYCAFYTPLRFSDGYVDSYIPSAGLVSNLFMEKYRSRQPYFIIAGPNSGAISAAGLVGPDYNYSREELNIIEPYGVNCMVYRSGFGTFINANQTAKQTPKSALSSINVRELVIYLMDEIENVLQAYQWEFNNAQVRAAIKDRADAICTRVQVNGGLQAFLNVMDESNNDNDIIDNEFAVLSTYIEPGRGMGKMVHELTIHRSGGMSSTTID
ncbi:MAG: hypothetical protein J1F35_03255 [Erysipelotrichales bacterium]|nr:hypothetical protein [Erysipelotrichales bacterium]